MATALPFIALALFAAAFFASRRWIGRRGESGAPRNQTGRARTLQKFALGAWGLVIAVNILEVTVGDERLDALRILVLVSISIAGACLVYELRKPVSKLADSE